MSFVVKHCRSYYEQNSIVNTVRANDWRAVIANNGIFFPFSQYSMVFFPSTGFESLTQVVHDNCLSIAAIQEGSFNSWRFSPIGPKQQSAVEQWSFIVDRKWKRKRHRLQMGSYRSQFSVHIWTTTKIKVKSLARSFSLSLNELLLFPSLKNISGFKTGQASYL